MAVLFSDDFNRADSTGLGVNWVTCRGTGLDVRSQRASSAIHNESRGSLVTGVSYPSDQYAKAVLQLDNKTATYPYMSIFVRASGSEPSTLTGYRAQVGGTNALGVDELYFSKFINNVETNLGVTSPITIPAMDTGDVLKLVAEGNLISVYINDELIDSEEDSSITSGAPGLDVFASSYGTGDYIGWDDFESGSMESGPDSTIYTLTGDSFVTVTDAVQHYRQLNRQAAESITLTDAALVARVRTLLSSDSLALADAILFGAVRGRTRDDSLSLTDALVKFLIRGRRIEDALEVWDSYLYDLISSGALYVKTSTDSLDVLDALARVVFSLRIVGDTLTVTEATVRGVGRTRTVSENLTLLDALVAGAVRGRTTTDSLAVTDHTALSAIRRRLATDLLATTDETARYRVLHRALSDAVTTLLDGLSHSISRDVVITRLADDALLVTDSNTYALRLTRRLSDALDLTDDLLGDRGAYTRTLSDTIALADALTSYRTAGRVATDTLGLSDQSLRFLRRLVVASDTIALTDGQLNFSLRARAVLDALEVTDGLVWTHISGLVNLIDVRVRLGLIMPSVDLSVEHVARTGVEVPNIETGAYN